MWKDTIEKLRELAKQRDSVRDDKLEAIKDQKYEVAADLRNKEKNLITSIDQEIQLKKDDFEDEETLIMVYKNIQEIVNFIHEGDTNIVPALIRKLKTDTIKIKTEVEKLKKEIQTYK